jgi:hypothetical protein
MGVYREKIFRTAKKCESQAKTLKTQRRSRSLAGVESFGAGAKPEHGFVSKTTPSVPAALGRGPENVGTTHSGRALLE